jgi:hypothetical protein
MVTSRRSCCKSNLVQFPGREKPYATECRETEPLGATGAVLGTAAQLLQEIRRLIFSFCSPILFRMPEDEKQRGALLIAACLVAAIRLRGEPIQPSPKLKATIYDSVQLAVLVWRELQMHGSLPKN